mmetsp:Transcript_646/g.2032  ORF Transcript_646/g.2032 Transcript_646/m.2032 type:complete len:238 (+) Transcript_646:1-714(+)
MIIKFTRASRARACGARSCSPRGRSRGGGPAFSSFLLALPPLKRRLLRHGRHAGGGVRSFEKLSQPLALRHQVLHDESQDRPRRDVGRLRPLPLWREHLHADGGKLCLDPVGCPVAAGVRVAAEEHLRVVPDVREIQLLAQLHLVWRLQRQDLQDQDSQGVHVGGAAVVAVLPGLGARVGHGPRPHGVAAEYAPHVVGHHGGLRAGDAGGAVVELPHRVQRAADAEVADLAELQVLV